VPELRYPMDKFLIRPLDILKASVDIAISFFLPNCLLLLACFNSFFFEFAPFNLSHGIFPPSRHLGHICKCGGSFLLADQFDG